MIKITKKEAIKLFNSNENIYIMPSRLIPYVVYAPVLVNNKYVNNFSEYIQWYEKTYCTKCVGRKIQFYKF